MPITKSYMTADLFSVSLDKFIMLVENESLWFTRIFNWRRQDPCEAILLPVFRKQLIHPSKNKEAIDWEVANLELGLKSCFGCCFVKHDGSEKAHMWHIYCPENEGHGVIVHLRADSVYKAMSDQLNEYRLQHLREVVYITDAEARSMNLKDTKHSYSPHNTAYFDAAESLFYKRKAYESEKEVRAVLSKGTFEKSYLFWFAGRHGLPIQQYDQATFNALSLQPIPKDTLRIRMSGDDGYFSLTLDMQKTSLLIKAIEDEFETTFPMLRDETGTYIKFPLDDIEAITMHPAICRDNEKLTKLKVISREYGLENKLVESELVRSKWY